MIIEYSFVVEELSENGKSLTVRYKSSGKKDFLIGMPAPTQNQSLESIIETYAPIQEWLMESAEYQPVSLGTQGTKSFDTISKVEKLLQAFKQLKESFTPLRNESVSVIEHLDIYNLKIDKLYNSTSNLVAISLQGPSEQASVEQGTKMFNSASLVINKAKAIGVTVYAETDKQNVRDFLVNIHNFTEVLVEGVSLLYWHDASKAGKKFIYSSQQFLNKFSASLQESIITTSDVQVRKIYDLLIAADYIDITDARVSQGLDLLIFKGLLTPEDKALILTPGD